MNSVPTEIEPGAPPITAPCPGQELRRFDFRWA